MLQIRTLICFIFFYLISIYGLNSALDIETRIIGGEPRSNSAMLVLRNNAVPNSTVQPPVGLTRCGAVPITKHCVLTAGHCMSVSSDNPDCSVSGGINVLQGSPYTTVVLKSVVHPKYTTSYSTTGYQTMYREFDLALLKIQPFPENSGITLLPLLDVDETCPENGASVWGYGNTVPTDTLNLTINPPTFSPVLMVAEPMTIMTNEEADAILGNNGIVGPDKMFAKGDHKGACYGDSGGPLICNNKLFGIVSFITNCLYDKYPGGYANVNYLRDFIIDTCASFEPPPTTS